MKHLSSYCKQVLSATYYARVRAHCRVFSEAQRAALGWESFEPFDGEDYMYQTPGGRRWLTDADEPANAVEVTDVPLEHATEPAPKPDPSTTLDFKAATLEILDRWPHAIGVRFDVAYPCQAEFPDQAHVLVGATVGFVDGSVANIDGQLRGQATQARFAQWIQRASLWVDVDSDDEPNPFWTERSA